MADVAELADALDSKSRFDPFSPLSSGFLKLNKTIVNIGRNAFFTITSRGFKRTTNLAQKLAQGLRKGLDVRSTYVGTAKPDTQAPVLDALACMHLAGDS